MSSDSSQLRSSSPQGVKAPAFGALVRRRWLSFVLVFVLVLIAGIGVSLATKPTFEVRGTFMPPQLPPDGGPPSVGPAKTGDAEPAPLMELLRSLQSPGFMKAAVAEAKAPHNPADGLPVIFTSGDADSGMIAFTIKGANPVEIAAVANVVPPLLQHDWYQDYQSKLHDQIAAARAQLRTASRNLGEAERALVAFRAQHPVKDIDIKRETATKQNDQSVLRLSSAELNLQTIRAEIAAITTKIDSMPKSVEEETAKANPKRAALSEKVASLESERELLLHDFLPGSDEVQAVDARLSTARKQLGAEPEFITDKLQVPNGKRASLETRLAELEATAEATSAEIQTLRTRAPVGESILPQSVTEKWSMDEAKLIDDRAAAQSVYAGLSRRVQALELKMSAPAPSPVEFRKVPAPKEPTTPNHKRDIALAAIAALILGLGAVFAQEYLDETVYSPSDLEVSTPLPSLALLPFFDNKLPRQISALPVDSHPAEAYRMLRSSIGFVGSGSDQKRLLVTSASVGEGKSLISMNLAASTAMAGKKVILVDADLRRPTLHSLLGVPNHFGLCEVLSNRVAWQDALQDTSIPNLRVLTAGRLQSSAAELLGSPGLKTLLAELCEATDALILDSPPCLGIVDPLLLASEVDGVLLVVRAGSTKVPEVLAAQEQLHRAQSRLLGIVYNDVPADQGTYSRGYYHYARGAGGLPHYFPGQNGHAAAAQSPETARIGRPDTSLQDIPEHE